MDGYEFDKLKTGDFVRNPYERGSKVIFVVEGKSKNRVRGLEGMHRDITIREVKTETDFFRLPSYTVKNDELYDWEIVTPEEAKFIQTLYSDDERNGNLRPPTGGTGIRK